MRALKCIAFIAILSISVIACSGDRNKATLGGTKDTMSVAGSGDSSNLDETDTTQKDTANKGNANPSGHGLTDTTNSRPVH